MTATSLGASEQEQEGPYLMALHSPGAHKWKQTNVNKNKNPIILDSNK